jgi:hypothetical protein
MQKNTILLLRKAANKNICTLILIFVLFHFGMVSCIDFNSGYDQKDKAFRDSLFKNPVNKIRIGNEYKNEKELGTFIYRSGSMIGYNGSVINCYGITILEYVNCQILLFEKSVRREGDHAVNLILDTVHLPLDAYVKCIDCRINQVPDEEIIALLGDIPSRDEEYTSNIKYALRANRKTEKLEVISTRWIDCKNPDHGF